MAATKKMDVRLADDDIVIFIELFHEHDCLWNVGSTNYHKNEHCLTALRAIGAEMETRTNKIIYGIYVKQRLLVYIVRPLQICT